MQIIELSDGAASCHVVVPGTYQGEAMTGATALDAALECAWASDYFDRESGGEYHRRAMYPLELLAISFDGYSISHTVREWRMIYDGIIREPVIISQSEH
jgi:hypothetical protein